MVLLLVFHYLFRPCFTLSNFTFTNKDKQLKGFFSQNKAVYIRSFISLNGYENQNNLL